MVSLHDILLYYFFLMAGDMSQIATPIADEVASYGASDEATIAALREREQAGELDATDPEVQELLMAARSSVVDMKESELQMLHAQVDLIDAVKQAGTELQHGLYASVEKVEKEEEDVAAGDVLASW